MPAHIATDLAHPTAPAVKSISRLGLGTVQFGMAYGMAKPLQPVPLSTIRNILRIAHEQGIRVIDTAPAYGGSEDMIGRTLPEEHRFHIVTKTLAVRSNTITKDDARRLRQTFLHSISTLRQTVLHGLLVHHTDDLMIKNGSYLMDEMLRLKQDGLVRKIGVSVYTARQIDQILSQYKIDIIQIPLSVFDQRLIQSGHIKRLKELAIEIHARSVFLQGALLLSQDRLPPYFAAARKLIRQYHQAIQTANVSLPAAALNFIAQIPDIDCILIGVNSAQELQENIAAFRCNVTLSYDQFAINDETIVNPSLWPPS